MQTRNIQSFLLNLKVTLHDFSEEVDGMQRSVCADPNFKHEDLRILNRVLKKRLHTITDKVNEFIIRELSRNEK